MERSDGDIPCRVWIGVTGHRDVADGTRLRAAIGQVLDDIRSQAGRTGLHDVRFGVCSALSEGADRIVARAVLDLPDAQLEAVLPLDPVAYRQDFGDAASRREFDELLGQSALLTRVASGGRRDVGYVLAGEHIVQRCDVLVAVWDEQPGRGLGGTADVVHRAALQKPDLPIYRVVPPEYQLRADGQPLDLTPLAGVREFNRAATTDHTMTWLNDLVDLAQGDDVQREVEWIRSAFTRANELAVRRQRRLNRGIAFMLLGSAAAVALAAGQALLAPELAGLSLVEASLLVALLVLVESLRRARLHERWLAYRALAEWCRSSLLRALVAPGAGGTVAQPGTIVAFGHKSGQWVPRACEEVWLHRPRDLTPQGLAELRPLVLAAWIRHQTNYHTELARRLERTDRRLTRAIYATFLLTVFAAVAHFAMHGADKGWESRLGFLSVTLPAVGAAFAGIRAHREFQRNAERSRHMATDLLDLGRRIEDETDPDRFRAACRDVADRLIEENRIWYDVMLYHDVELHV